MSVHVLGIRHHGPGSARNVSSFLQELKPDIVLVEGPPEADGILQWSTHADIKPPVAILCYQPDDPRQSVFYPFAEFSPEWQAIQYAGKNKIPVRFFDLPIAHQFAIQKEKDAAPSADNTYNSPGESETMDIRSDPVSYLAEAAGFEDGEKWWEQMFEYRHNCEQVFDAVTEAMESLRETLRLKEDKLELMREAHMRKMIRQAEKEMYSTIAVVCGAWHAPALSGKPKQKDDNELLKGLSKSKVDCTWIPWTYNRLSFFSGYGAGIQSPGWYEENWHYPKDDGTRWMAKVAHLFRKNGMDTSVAHVIEAVRLAETLAALRGLSKPGLEELNEATVSVLCNGETVLLQLISDELIVSNKVGEVPLDIPKPPLQVDIEKQQKSLRLPATADFKDYILDLRKETDLARSILLHRLQLLGISWGKEMQVTGKGTFKEQWRLQWDPEFSIAIIEKGAWGNTIEQAANHYAVHLAQESQSLVAISDILKEALLAELQIGVEVLIQRINNLAAASGDVVQLMEVVPSLASVSRYGNVRKTDAELVMQILRSIITRVFIGLPNASTALDEESAQKLMERIYQLHEAVVLLEEQDITAQWQQTLRALAFGENTAPVIAGYATRLLCDYKALRDEQLVSRFHYRMSAANAPDISAAWLEGFLRGSGSILLIDHDLWNLVNQWVSQLDAGTFTQVLPLLRRTFSNFKPPERRKLGEKVKGGNVVAPVSILQESGLDRERGVKGLPVVMHLLGIPQITLNDSE